MPYIARCFSLRRVRPRRLVVVAQAEVKSFPLSAEALGNARANESVDIRPKITATLTEILFEEGQAVAAGEVLVKLDDLEQVADLAAARGGAGRYGGQLQAIE